MQHITFNEFLPLVLGKSGIHEHGLTLYAKVSPLNGRIHREKSTFRHIRALAYALRQGGRREKYRDARPGIHDHGFTLYAKEYPQT